MKKTVQLNLDKTPYLSKPTGPQIGLVKSKAATVEITLPELIAAIERGQTVIPAVMNGTKATDWQEQQIFMVDIDNVEDGAPILTPEDALVICRKNNILPAFYYPTFSDATEKPKYRLVFVLSEIVRDTKERAIIAETLISLLPQADKACKNADRVFLGTNKKCVACDLDVRVPVDNIYRLYTPPKPPQVNSHNNKSSNLQELKDKFDLFGYMQQRNGAYHQISGGFMFETCELCGHRHDLVYYNDTNSFKCFGGHGGEGGDAIKYVQLAEHLDFKGAVKRICELVGEDCHKYIKQKSKQNRRGNFSNIIDSTLYKRVSKLGLQGFTIDDKGFSRIFGKICHDRLCHNETENEWYYFNGKVWCADKNMAEKTAKSFSDVLTAYALANNLDDTVRVKISKLGVLRNRKSLLEDSQCEMRVTKNDFDKNIFCFNCQNGSMDLKTFEFRPHKADDMLTKISNVIYDPNAVSERWLKFIADVMQGNKSKIEYLQKILGYSLTGDVSQETFFIFAGATRAGKSTLLETISYLMGETNGYACTIHADTFDLNKKTNTQAASGDIARLDGYRFATVNEVQKSSLLNSALIKRLTGRDTIVARQLYQKETQFRVNLKLYFNTNYLPQVSDDTLFESGRTNVIIFQKHLTSEEQDKHLKDILRTPDNISGIFNWLLKGLKMYYETGLTPPEEVVKATAQYREDSDKIFCFMRDCLIAQEGNNLQAKDIYNCYRKWAESNGYKSENKGRFFTALRNKNMLAERGTVDGRTVNNVLLGYAFNDTAIEEIGYEQPIPTRNRSTSQYFERPQNAYANPEDYF